MKKLLMLFVFVVVASSLQAQGRNSSLFGPYLVSPRFFEGEVVIGAQPTNESFRENLGIGEKDIGKIMFGLRLGVNPTPNFGLEGTFAMAPSLYDNYGYYYQGGGGFNSLFEVDFNAVYHTDIRRTLVPFATLGVGYQFLILKSEMYDDWFTWNTGVGLKYFLLDFWAIRADIRSINSFGGPGLHSWQVQLGASLFF